MEKIKIIHIHDGSSKFILPSLRHFNTEDFENNIVVFGNKNKLSPDLLPRINILVDIPLDYISMNKAIQDIVELCNSADLVILYDLTFTKSLVADKLNPNVTIIWQFYGYEIYRKIEHLVYSPLSASIIKKNFSETVKLNLEKISDNLKYLRQYGVTRDQIFNKAVKRIDYFWGLSSYEYKWLNENWGSLPKFLQRPRVKREQVEVQLSQKSNSIILGNNRNPFNNHLDLFNIIAPLQNPHNIKYKILFSYGISSIDSKYGKEVIHRASMIKNVTVIDKLLPREEFDKLYHNTSALVINGYRQMAMGNIFQALLSKVKVYMNEKNPIYTWLLSENFIIYSVEELATDIENNNIQLTEINALHNINQYNIMSEKYSTANFHEQLKHIVNLKKI